VAWNLLTQEKVGKPASLAQKTGQDLAVSPDGKDVASRITVAKHSSTVRVWSLETGKAVRDIACDEPLIHVSGCEFADANRTARDARFRQLLYVLWSVPIPYYIPQDADLSQLPGVTRIE